MVGTVGAGGLRNDSVIFDREDRAYDPLVIRLADGSTRNVLMVSWDHCRTWAVYRLPDGQFAMEHWVGHNQIDGPPFLAVWRPSTPNPAPRSKRCSLWVTQPRLDGDRLVMPPLVHVTDQCLGLGKDSGGSSFAVTANGVTTFVWSEATAHGKVTPQFVDSYDSATGTLAPAQLLMATPPANDQHVKPGICIDSQGYLHVVSGAHGGEILYCHSLAPYTIAAGWTLPVPVCTNGYIAPDGTERASQTYCAFVCDSHDVLHLVTRQFRRGVDAYFGGKLYGALVHQSCPPGGVWGPPTIIVVPSEPGYAVFYHKLALDHRDRLFLSCSSSGGQERIAAQQRGALLTRAGPLLAAARQVPAAHAAGVGRRRRQRGAWPVTPTSPRPARPRPPRASPCAGPRHAARRMPRRHGRGCAGRTPATSLRTSAWRTRAAAGPWGRTARCCAPTTAARTGTARTRALPRTCWA